jgi:hypothetical protein
MNTLRAQFFILADPSVGTVPLNPGGGTDTFLEWGRLTGILTLLGVFKGTDFSVSVF